MVTTILENPATKPAGRSKLLGKTLPQFEAPRDFMEYLDDRTGKARKQNANEVFEKAARAEMELQSKTDRTEDETLDALLSCIGAQNSLREILYKTLVECLEEKPLEDVERFIAQSDEMVYSHIIQTPFSLIQMLERSGGLIETAYDLQGNTIDPDQAAAMDEDEFINTFDHATLTTTAAGCKALELISPERRFSFLISQRPHRLDTFYALMEYCRDPRTFPEIQQWFKDTPGLALDQVQTHHTLAPDFYVDKLDKAGVLIWKGAWVLTPEGEHFLAQRPSPEE